MFKFFESKFAVVIVEDNAYDGEEIRKLFSSQTRIECNVHLVLVQEGDKLQDVIAKVKKAAGSKGVILLDNHFAKVDFTGADIAPHFEGKVLSISGEPVRYARGWHFKRFLESKVAQRELVECVDSATRSMRFTDK